MVFGYKVIFAQIICNLNPWKLNFLKAPSVRKTKRGDKEKSFFYWNEKLKKIAVKIRKLINLAGPVIEI